jgi:hypothetical protein
MQAKYIRGLCSKCLVLLFLRQGSYDVEELIPRRKYVATHINAEKREKYMKSVFEVEVSFEGDFYTCECGLFEHMGMVCCHIIKVSNNSMVKVISLLLNVFWISCVISNELCRSCLN